MLEATLQICQSPQILQKKGMETRRRIAWIALMLPVPRRPNLSRWSTGTGWGHRT